MPGRHGTLRMYITVGTFSWNHHRGVGAIITLRWHYHYGYYIVTPLSRLRSWCEWSRRRQGWGLVRRVSTAISRPGSFSRSRSRILYRQAERKCDGQAGLKYLPAFGRNEVKLFLTLQLRAPTCSRNLPAQAAVYLNCWDFPVPVVP